MEKGVAYIDVSELEKKCPIERALGKSFIFCLITLHDVRFM